MFEDGSLELKKVEPQLKVESLSPKEIEKYKILFTRILLKRNYDYSVNSFNELQKLDHLSRKIYEKTRDRFFFIASLFAREMLNRLDNPAESFRIIKRLFKLTGQHEEKLDVRLVFDIYVRYLYQLIAHRDFGLYQCGFQVAREFVVKNKFKEGEPFLALLEMQHSLSCGEYRKILENENQLRNLIISAEIWAQKLLSGWFYRLLGHANFGIGNYKTAEFYYRLSAEDFLLGDKPSLAVISLFWNIRVSLALLDMQKLEKEIKEILDFQSRYFIHDSLVKPLLHFIGAVRAFHEGRLRASERQFLRVLKSGLGYRMKTFIYPYLAGISLLKGDGERALYWAELGVKSKESYSLWGGIEPEVLYYRALLFIGENEAALSLLKKIKEYEQKELTTKRSEVLRVHYLLRTEEINSAIKECEKIFNNQWTYESYDVYILFLDSLRELRRRKGAKAALDYFERNYTVFQSLRAEMFYHHFYVQEAFELQHLYISLLFENKKWKKALSSLRWFTSHPFMKSHTFSTKIQLSYHYDVLEYFYDCDTVYIILNNGNKIVSIKESEITSVLEAVSSGKYDVFKPGILHKLYELLIKPVEASLLSENLVIVPYRELFLVPFKLLFDGERFMFEKHNITIIPAYRFLASGPYKADFTSLLGVAITRIGRREYPFTLWEIKKAARYFERTRVLIDEESEKVFGLAPYYDVIHIATHSVEIENDPSKSYYTLKKDNLRVKPLRLNEFLNIKFSRNPLIIISSCGLPRAFFSLENIYFSVIHSLFKKGISGVLFTRTEVRDRETMLLMELFYEEFATGKRPFIALTSALRKLYNDYMIRDPLVLGSFVYFGL